jgi:glycerol-3-phosphate acyltransferase PlsX
MADSYSRHILHKSYPSVGLLNIGEEATKGTDFIKETHKLLSDSNLNFMGNMEGRDIFAGNTDIIVCDGFVGNVVLKVAEGIGWAIGSLLKKQLKKNIMTKLGALLSIQAFRGLSKEIDYAEYGGAPLLGVDGRCIICHGSSNAKAIKNAIRVAGEFMEHRVNQHIVEELEKTI